MATRSYQPQSSQKGTSAKTSASGSYQSDNFKSYYSPTDGDRLASNVESYGRSEDLWNEGLMNRTLDREFGRQSQAFGQKSAADMAMAKQNVRGQKDLMNTQGFWDTRQSQLAAQNQLAAQQAATRSAMKLARSSGGDSGSGGGGSYAGYSAAENAARADANAIARERMNLDAKIAGDQNKVQRDGMMLNFLGKDTSYWR